MQLIRYFSCLRVAKFKLVSIRFLDLDLLSLSYFRRSVLSTPWPTMTDGYYFILSHEDLSKCLEIESSGTQGHRLVSGPVRKEDNDRQLWKINERSELESKAGLVADICEGNRKEGAGVISWTANNGCNQKWTFVDGHIISSMNDLVMEVDKGGHITMARCNDKNQMWTFLPERRAESDVDEQFCFIVSQAEKNKCLEIENGGHQGHRLVCSVLKCENNDNQLWALSDADELKSKTSFVADVSGEDRSAGAGVIAWTPHGGGNQKWSVHDGHVMSLMTGLVMQVDEGGEVRMASPNRRQMWSFVADSSESSSLRDKICGFIKF